MCKKIPANSNFFYRRKMILGKNMFKDNIKGTKQYVDNKNTRVIPTLSFWFLWF